MFKSESSSISPGVAVYAGSGQVPRLIPGAAAAGDASSSSSSPEVKDKRKTSRRGALAIALCIAAASYLSVLAANSGRALSSAHQHTADERGPGEPGERRSAVADAAIAGITMRAEERLEARLREGGGQAAAGGMHWPAVMPNTGRSEDGDKGVDVDSGTRSRHGGGVQRQRQGWLTRRARDLRRGEMQARVNAAAAESLGTAQGGAGGGTAAAAADQEDAPREGGADESRTGGPQAGSVAGHATQHFGLLSTEERADRMELGARLWNATYVPPIEPGRRLELIEKWSGNATRRDGSDRANGGGKGEGEDIPGGRILYVVSSFDRGQRLAPKFRGHDKLDFILMMMDEMREACEVGFSPQVHLIAAWNLSEVEGFVRDRLLCRRTGVHVPYSLEEHPPSIRNDLSLKHRVYMKTRLEDFDVFLQVEDDIILTLNHIMIFQEESEVLEKRRRPDGRPVPNSAVPGFIRIEHLHGDAGTFSGPESGEEWLEWEICLSRFRAMKILEAGTYLTLGPSQPLPHGGNNQGMWLATREQLRKLSQKKSCEYLSFDESSGKGHVETYSGSIQMFRPNCGLQKVFPARNFESFLVHHRTNNKLGIRGESVPGVPVSLLREWVEQFIRDESFLKSEWNAPQHL